MKSLRGKATNTGKKNKFVHPTNICFELVRFVLRLEISVFQHIFSSYSRPSRSIFDFKSTFKCMQWASRWRKRKKCRKLPSGSFFYIHVKYDFLLWNVFSTKFKNVVLSESNFTRFRSSPYLKTYWKNFQIIL